MNLLRHIHIFRDLQDSDLEKLGKIAAQEEFQAGDVLFREGDPSTAFYIIQKGAVVITKEGGAAGAKTLAELASGDFFGEMGVIEETPRYATATVVQPSSIFVVQKTDFDDLMAVNPSIAMKIMVTVTRRYKADVEGGGDFAVGAGESAAPKTDPEGPDEAPPQPTGRLIAVQSPTGGAGVSTIACNLAVALADRGKKVLLIDASTQFGDLAVLLDVIPNTTLYQMAEEENWDPVYIRENYCNATKFGVDFIAAPLKPEQAEMVTADLFRILVDSMRQTYEYILIDTFHLMQEPVLTLLEMADEILYVLNPELPSMKNARLWLELLSALEFTRAPVRTLLNKWDQRAIVSKETIEKNLQTTVDLVIPYDRDSTMKCINRGEMLVRYVPREPISKALLSLADKVLNVQTKPVEAEASFFSSWMGRLKSRFNITG